MPNSLRIGRKHMTEYMISFASGFNELRRELRKALKISYDKEKLADFSDRLHDTSIQRKELLDELLKVIDVIITRALTIVQEKKLFIKQLENIKLHLIEKMLYWYCKHVHVHACNIIIIIFFANFSQYVFQLNICN